MGSRRGSISARVIPMLGGSVVAPAMDIEPGRFAVLSDPTGAVFNVLAMKAGMTST